MKWMFFVLLGLAVIACGKSGGDPDPEPPPPGPASFTFNSLTLNGSFTGYTYYNINTKPIVRIRFSAPLNKTSISPALSFKDKSGAAVAYNTSFENNDSTVVVQPVNPLSYLTRYSVSVSTALRSAAGGALLSAVDLNFTTAIDSTAKFPSISDEALLDLVQKQTFKYFWDFGHPVSGMARERNTSGDVVTTGGTGFGVMAIIAAVNRNFVSRTEGLARIQKIVSFLKTAKTYKGAFPHWMNGATGATVPFSQKDDGADLVETSYLMQGLLSARQYFNGADIAESSLRSDINALWNAVQWNWFRKNNEDVLYWHWSENFNFDMNHKIQGWNECLITYVLAASSANYSIPKTAYDIGWAGNGSMKNGNTYNGIKLPLGPNYGGPLFFSHYSFLGLRPSSLKDAYADYAEQTRAHTLISYNYCKANPKSYYGYSDACWGLTASDDISGYKVHDPVNDNSVISPTAALSSMPYTPEESMRALRFFYYQLGDRIWKEYGFVDAFSLHEGWFADSFLAIDQGPIIIMIENYRSGLLWDLFMSCPEVKTGLTKLGFQ
jgi:hypothetical protein